MAFTLEDGSGIENANSYVSLSYVNDYHSDRGNSSWGDFTDSEKQASIIRASEYVDKRFGKKFKGFRKVKNQGLEWPRLDAFDSDGYLLDEIPFQLEKAVSEYALRSAICGVLAPDPINSTPKQDLTDANGERDTGTVITGEISRRKEIVGPIEEEFWYDTRSANKNLGSSARSIQSSLVDDNNIPEYPEADLWIEELIISGPSIKLARA